MLLKRATPVLKLLLVSTGRVKLLYAGESPMPAWTVDLPDRKRSSLLAAPLDLGPEQLDSCPAFGVPILQYTAP